MSSLDGDYPEHPSAAWYAVQTKPRQERVAEDNLARQDYTTYLPRLKTSKHRRGQWVDVVEPLFPRYLFIHVDPDEHSIAPVRSTLGVANLVRFGHRLKPVPTRVIDYLKQHEDPATHELADPAPRFTKGQRLEKIGRAHV